MRHRAEETDERSGVGVFHGIYLLVAGVPVLLSLAARRRRSGIAPRRVLLESAFGLYLLLVVVVVLFPLRVSPGLRADNAVWDYATFIRDWTNLVPLASIEQVLRYSSTRQAVKQLGGNLVLLAPLGVFAPALFRRFRGAVSMLALALAAGLGIESIQYLARVARLSLRSVDIDDALLNVTGAMVGYFAWRVFKHVERVRRTDREVRT